MEINLCETDPITLENYLFHPLVKNILNNIDFPFYRSRAIRNLEELCFYENFEILNKIKIDDESFSYVIIYVRKDFFEHGTFLWENTDLTGIEIFELLASYLHCCYRVGFYFNIPENRKK